MHEHDKSAREQGKQMKAWTDVLMNKWGQNTFQKHLCLKHFLVHVSFITHNYADVTFIQAAEPFVYFLCLILISKKFATSILSLFSC